MKPYDLKDRSYSFSVEVIKLVRTLPKESASFAIGGQLIRSATSVGANIIEGSAASSKKDFINFYNHSLKSAVESEYWLKLLGDVGLTNGRKVDTYVKEAVELSKILGSVISKSKGKSKK